MKPMIDFIVSRLKERSTWLGLVSLVTALGLVLTPAQSEAIIAAGMGLAGLIGTLTGDVK